MVTKKGSEKKTIKIHKKIHKELSDLGKKGDTFDSIISRLLIQKRVLEDSLNKLSKEDKERIIKKMEANYEKWL